MTTRLQQIALALTLIATCLAVHGASITPLAAPLFLEPGRVPIKGLAEEKLLAEQAGSLLQEAGVPDQIVRPVWRVPY